MMFADQMKGSIILTPPQRQISAARKKPISSPTKPNEIRHVISL